jgi:hypothetical protein
MEKGTWTVKTGLAQMLKGGGMEGGSPEIGMNDNPGCVYYPPER